MAIAYRDISEFKYVLAEDYVRQLPDWTFGAVAVGPCITINQWGLLWVKSGYPWDGPSGPTFDRVTNREPSLVHDVGYELIRAGCLPGGSGRAYFDRLFRDDAIAKGMSPFWAKWYYYFGLRSFAAYAAKRRKSKKYEIVRE